MSTQNLKNHSRYVPLFHFILSAIILVILVLAAMTFYDSLQNESGIVLSIMFLFMAIALVIIFITMRNFPLRAQDRAIRAEENLRHFVMAGKLLDKGLTMNQIVALRFAEDEEFLALAVKAQKENMSSKDIKQAICNWRADHHRA